MGLIKYLVALAFIGLFSIAIISYVTNYTTENSSNITLGNEFSQTSTRLKSGFDSFETDANSSSGFFEKSSIKSGDENVEGGSFIKVPRRQLYTNTKNIMNLTNSQIFGNDVSFGIVTTLIISLLATILVLYAWKTWKGGNPD